MTSRAIAVVGLSLALGAALWPPLLDANQGLRLIHSERSLYRQIFVYEDSDERCLCFIRSCTIGRQSCIDRRHPDHLVFDYTKMMLGALYLRPDPRAVLII